jgi:hypothetical protein
LLRMCGGGHQCPPWGNGQLRYDHGRIASSCSQRQTATTAGYGWAKTLEKSGDKWALAILLVNLCHVLMYCGELDGAIAAAREGVRLSQETADRRSLAWCLTELGAALARRQEAARAVRLWGAVERISQSIGSPVPRDENSRATVQNVRGNSSRLSRAASSGAGGTVMFGTSPSA